MASACSGEIGSRLMSTRDNGEAEVTGMSIPCWSLAMNPDRSGAGTRHQQPGWGAASRLGGEEADRVVDLPDQLGDHRRHRHSANWWGVVILGVAPGVA